MKSLFDLIKEPLPQTLATTKPVNRKIAVIDCETDPFKRGRLPVPFIWGFYDEENYEEFTTVESFIQFLENQTQAYRIYAHNGGKFDYHFMLNYLEPFSQVTIINGRLSKFKIGEHEFRDSFNLFNFPLAVYKKDDIDYCIMEKKVRWLPWNKKKISDYLYKDCLYLFELVTGFVDSYGLHLTQASAAMKIWQKMEDRKAPETTEHYYDSQAPFYYGGRVECFKKGLIYQPFSVIDITSAYPFAMTFLHPISETYKSYTGKKVLEFVEENGGIEDTFFSPTLIRCMARSRGALPFRGKDKLEFPNDGYLRSFSITGWEIQAGIRTGTLTDIRIQEVRVWDELINFKDYVDYFFKQKAEAKKLGDKLTELFAKLFLNALYGKFAADPRNYKTFTIAETEDIANMLADGYTEGGFLGPWFIGERPLMEEMQRFYNIATAASITGFVRAYLWEAACKCGGLIYSDTDSIAAHDISKLDLSSELGGWDLEAECDYGAVAGRKMYAFRKLNGKYKKACKGARLSPQEIIDVAKGKKVIYDPETPTYSVHKPPRFTKREIVRT